MSKHADQLDALLRLRTFLAATSDRPDSASPTDAPSFRTLRLVADLADAKADAR